MGELKLLGAIASPFTWRVLWALKLKGIAYEYFEEDLYNKSPLLFQSNPVHKKIPVLLIGDKPICESMLIVEYLDETWPERYPLFPTDPYERSVARFWIKFAEDKVIGIWWVFYCKGDEYEKAVIDSLEMLKTIEEYGLGVKKFFGGDKIDAVDIAYAQLALWLGIIEEVVGIKVLDPHSFPKFHTWAENFKEEPIVKENLPDRDGLLTQYKAHREKALAYASH